MIEDRLAKESPCQSASLFVFKLAKLKKLSSPSLPPLFPVDQSRVRLCVQTNNYEKLQPTCVLCPSRQQLAKTMELCTGSSDYQSNITFQQAKCLISICNRNVSDEPGAL